MSNSQNSSFWCPCLYLLYSHRRCNIYSRSLDSVNVTKLIRTVLSGQEPTNNWTISYNKLVELRKNMNSKRKLPGAKIYNLRLYDIVVGNNKPTKASNQNVSLYCCDMVLEATGLAEKDRQAILEMVMDVSGAKHAATERLTKLFLSVEKSFNKMQRKEVKRRGYTFLEAKQVEKLLNEHGIHLWFLKSYSFYMELTLLVSAENLLYVPFQPVIRDKRALPVAVLAPLVLAPYMFAPVVGISVLGPVVLSPNIFSPLLVNPSLLSPFVLSPAVGMPFILSPYLLSPYVMTPIFAAPFILSPYVLSPNVLNPYIFSPLILSPYVLCPDILSPQALGGRILSPSILSPSLLTESVLMASVLSPTFLS
ncbi:unnamed protein product [Toxocara canis]|uniref:P-loop containing nucleoside triphosphatehydrolases superfamily protein n=1 Tax=Toxocara canis TaxID=6265 RepID=A0A183TXL1_TOXCA|nr:unnamed protein product [Toxocara canis]